MKLFAAFLLATLCVSAVLVNGQSEAEEGPEEQARPEDDAGEAGDDEPTHPGARQGRPSGRRIFLRSKTRAVRPRPGTSVQSESPMQSAQVAEPSTAAQVDPTTTAQANPVDLATMFSQIQSVLQAIQESLHQLLVNSATPPPPPALPPVVVPASALAAENNGTVAVQARMSDEQLGEVVEAISQHLTDLINNNGNHRNNH